MHFFRKRKKRSFSSNGKDNLKKLLDNILDVIANGINRFDIDGRLPFL